MHYEFSSCIAVRWHACGTLGSLSRQYERVGEGKYVFLLLPTSIRLRVTHMMCVGRFQEITHTILANVVQPTISDKSQYSVPLCTMRAVPMSEDLDILRPKYFL